MATPLFHLWIKVKRFYDKLHIYFYQCSAKFDTKVDIKSSIIVKLGNGCTFKIHKLRIDDTGECIVCSLEWEGRIAGLVDGRMSMHEMLVVTIMQLPIGTTEWLGGMRYRYFITVNKIWIQYLGEFYLKLVLSIDNFFNVKKKSLDKAVKILIFLKILQNLMMLTS